MFNVIFLQGKSGPPGDPGDAGRNGSAVRHFFFLSKHGTFSEVYCDVTESHIGCKANQDKSALLIEKGQPFRAMGMSSRHSSNSNCIKTFFLAFKCNVMSVLV